MEAGESRGALLLPEEGRREGGSGVKAVGGRSGRRSCRAAWCSPAGEEGRQGACVRLTGGASGSHGIQEYSFLFEIKSEKKK